MEITIFKNIKNTSQPFYREVEVVLKRIKEGASKDLVKRIREEQDKTKRNEIKQSLPAICFSGQFTKRNDNSLSKHSGLICLDFDCFPNEKMMLEEKEIITQDRYTFACFISPSGLGLKVLVKIPADPDTHKQYFNSLQHHFGSEFFDVSVKNVSRVCYESYDPLIYVNPNSSVWDQIIEQEYNEISSYDNKATIPVTDENKIVDILVKWWEKKYGMIEGERNNNVYILASAFNDFGVNQTLAEYVMSQYSSDSFPPSEVKRTIQSAYSQRQNFGTKFYEDKDKVNFIKHKLRSGVTKKEISCPEGAWHPCKGGEPVDNWGYKAGKQYKDKNCKLLLR